MLNATDTWFLQQGEPARSCLLFLRNYILTYTSEINEDWKYGMPFYTRDKKRFCYLWFHKKYKQPYIGFVDGNQMKDPDLLAEKRSRMKIFLIDPEKDLPLKKIDKLLKEALALCGS